MASAVRHVTIDSADPYRLAEFWAGVLGGSVSDDDHPGDEEALVELPGAGLLFIAVPGPKTVKNRVHLDVSPRDRGRDEEVERVLALGAALVADHRGADGTGWVTMGDPEGDEFCVEGADADRS